jgi:hypothetical protein
MNKFWLLLSCCIIFTKGMAQPFNKPTLLLLHQKEDTLKHFADKLVNANSAAVRFQSDSAFTKILVQALKTPYSFYYRFDSLLNISKLYAPDSSFRIFTWQMVVNENLTRQHGAIQIHTADGSLKLFPLIDKSDVTTLLADTTADNKGWIGAVYYKILSTNNMNQTYYTLLGFDENNIRSNRKIIEVLSFENDLPVFGGSYFSFAEDADKKPTASRHILEYQKDAGARLVYDEDLKMIIAEHLYSPSNEPQKKWTLIPDGDYEGFKWQQGKWVHVEKVFNQVTAEGSEPMPIPVKDAMGNTLDSKLKDNLPNEKAYEEVTETAPIPKKNTPVKKIKPKKKG